MIDYATYKFKKGERIQVILSALAITSGIAYLFYQSMLMVVVFAPFSIVLVRWRKKQLIEKRYEQLEYEFREAILSISNAMSAGYSIENAIIEAQKDLNLLYEGHAYMLQELAYMTHQISLNKTMEEIFQEFAKRIPLEDIENFVDVFVTAKRTGGDIIRIINTTSKNINDKQEIDREIKTLITAKKYESTIMSLVPLGIIVYMWVTSPGYLDLLYHNVVGFVVMSVLLGIYLVAFRLATKIMDIKV